MFPNPQQRKPKISRTEEIEEMTGKLDSQFVEEKLMHAVLENDQEIIDDAKVLREAMNQSIFSFIPDMMFERLVQHYKNAQQLYGERLLRFMTGYDPQYIQKNAQIPEFQQELKQKLREKLEELQEKGFVNKEGEITEKGLGLAAVSLYIEELDKLDAHGFLGEKLNEKQEHYGAPLDTRSYQKGDRYKDIAVRRSVKTAVRRQHTEFSLEDMKVFTRQAKGKIFVIYGIDASGSMKGEKIATCKRAGVALAFKALQEKDEVGLIVFGKKVETAIAPCADFSSLLKALTQIHAAKETDLAACILHAISLFPSHDDATKYLLLLTDAMPTVGDDPAQATLDAIEKAVAAGITVSLIGIQLDKKAQDFAQKIVDLGRGRLYIVKNLEEMDRIVLLDYYSHV